jgi:hypothetical protein
VERQQRPQVWNALDDIQRERLTTLGIHPTLEPEPEAAPPAEAGAGAGAGKRRTRPTAAFDRGVAALRQYQTRTGTVAPARGHVEVLEDGTEVRPGVWLSNIKTPTRLAKLNPEQRDALTELGVLAQ